MLPPPTPDEELMLRVQDGDQSAYRELFERHHARVYGYLLRRMQDRQVADDLFQETFLSVYRARHTWHAGRPFLHQQAKDRESRVLGQGRQTDDGGFELHGSKPIEVFN